MKRDFVKLSVEHVHQALSEGEGGLLNCLLYYSWKAEVAVELNEMMKI